MPDSSSESPHPRCPCQQIEYSYNEGENPGESGYSLGFRGGEDSDEGLEEMTESLTHEELRIVMLFVRLVSVEGLSQVEIRIRRALGGVSGDVGSVPKQAIDSRVLSGRRRVLRGLWAM